MTSLSVMAPSVTRPASFEGPSPPRLRGAGGVCRAAARPLSLLLLRHLGSALSRRSAEPCRRRCEGGGGAVSSRAGLTGRAGGGGGSGSKNPYRPASRRAIRRHPPRPAPIAARHPAPQALPAPSHPRRWVSGAGGGGCRGYSGR